VLLADLQSFEKRLRKLRSDIKGAYGTEGQVARKGFREEAGALATFWFQAINPQIETAHRDLQPQAREMSDSMQRLHSLTGPNNRASSYLRALDAALKKFKDRFIAPIQLSAPATKKTNAALDKVLTHLKNADESDYLAEAVACANEGYWRASIVLGWCAAVSRMQRVVEKKIGFTAFNAASKAMKAEPSGRYKRFTKEFNINGMAELQTVFDTDLMWVLEKLQYIDANQHQRLETCFEYRNHSAHPGEAPIEEEHLVVFYKDIDSIILSNAKFDA
jgi:hypothetical protein